MWAITGGVALTGKGALNLSKLAVNEINSAGGVMVGGKPVKLELYAYDEACKEQEGLALLSRLKDVDKVLFSLGPTCSGTAEPIFNTLQKTLDDPNDKGAQFLFFTDTASKFGLAKISPWVFRNTVDEPAMYQLIVKYLQDKRPDLKTVAVAWEPDFAHSSSTWKLIIKPTIEKNNYHRIVEVVEWSWQATDYSEQVSKLAKANADIYVTLTHEPTTCASFRELAKQGVKPKAIIAISSLAGGTVIVGCPDVAEGMIVPTNFAPVTPKAIELEKRPESLQGGKQSRSQPHRLRDHLSGEERDREINDREYRGVARRRSPETARRARRHSHLRRNDRTYFDQSRKSSDQTSRGREGIVSSSGQRRAVDHAAQPGRLPAKLGRSGGCRPRKVNALLTMRGPRSGPGLGLDGATA